MVDATPRLRDCAAIPSSRVGREIDTPAVQYVSGCECLPSQGGTHLNEEAPMTRRTRKWITAIMAAVVTTVLVWLPTAAQAGIAASGID
jgi:hypothetical protein